MAGFAGKINVYTCRKCKGTTVTVDRVDGTTPFIIRCEKFVRGRECLGEAESACYHTDQTQEPTHEWIRMTDGQAASCSASVMQHHLLGGLIMKLITPESNVTILRP